MRWITIILISFLLLGCVGNEYNKVISNKENNSERLKKDYQNKTIIISSHIDKFIETIKTIHSNHTIKRVININNQYIFKVTNNYSYYNETSSLFKNHTYRAGSCSTSLLSLQNYNNGKYIKTKKFPFCIHKTEVSKDKKYILLYSLVAANFNSPKEIILWDIKKGKEVRRFNSESSVEKAKITNDNRYIILLKKGGYKSGYIMLYEKFEISSGKKIASKKFNIKSLSSVKNLIFSSDDTKILYSSKLRLPTDIVYILDINTGNISNIKSKIRHDLTHEISQIVSSPNNQMIMLSEMNSNYIYLYSLNTKKLLYSVNTGSRIRDIKFSNDNKYFIIMHETSIKVRDIKNGKLLTSIAIYNHKEIGKISHCDTSDIENIVCASFGSKTEILKAKIFKKNIFSVIQNKIKENMHKYMLLDNIDIPPKIQKPKLPKLPTIIKSQFETKKEFQDRINIAIKEREKIIKKLQLKYRNNVEARNKILEEMEKERRQRINNSTYKNLEITKKIIKQYFNPYLSNPTYDAENQILYTELKSRNFMDYSKKLAFNMSSSDAKHLYPLIVNDTISSDEISITVVFDIKKNSLIFKNAIINDKVFENLAKIKNPMFKDVIKKLLDSKNQYGIKTRYYGKQTNKEYNYKIIKVSLKDKKIDFIANELQNPNLVDNYKVTPLLITNGEQNFQDDLPNLLSGVSTSSKDPKKWLFVIGAEQYDNTDDVTYSKRSAETFVKVAQKTLGVTERNSYALIGNQATSGAIEDKLNRMLENVKKGDNIYFFYSGHGIPLLPNRTPYLLPKDKIPDYIGRSPFFKLTNIYNLLSNSKASKVIAVMDSCFSGATDGVSIFKGVAGSVLVPKKVTFNHDKMVVLTAGRDKQFSNMYPQKGHRLFSYFVMKSLLEGKRAVSDVYNYVYPKIQSVSNGFGDLKRQEPTIEGNEELKF